MLERAQYHTDVHIYFFCPSYKTQPKLRGN